MDEPVGKFSFQGCRVMLTYRSHLPKEVFATFIEGNLGFAPKFMRCAHETGDEHHAYDHTHVLLHFGKNFKCQNARRFDYEGIHPHWKPVKTITHWNNELRYIAKEDPANADLLTEQRSLVDTVWSCATVHDALQRCTKPGDAPGILALYANKPREVPACKEPSFPWHKVAMELINSGTDHRSIHWFVDKVGNTGKSWFTRWACLSGLAYAITTGCGIKDFATIIRGAIDSGWNERCIIFDLPRQAEGFDSIYTLLEACVDGVVTATKYAGGTVFFQKPLVIVFSNYEPNRTRMSADRWRHVYHIGSDRCLTSSVSSLPTEAEGGLTLVRPPSPVTPELTREDNVKYDFALDELVQSWESQK